MRKIGQMLRFLIPIIALAVLVVFMTGAGRRERATLEKNKAIVMRDTEEVWTKGNVAVIDEIYASNYIRHNDTYPEGIIRGLEAYKKQVTNTHIGWPDGRPTVKAVIAEGDKVAKHGVWSGTFTGKVEGWPAPNGKKMTFEFVDIYKIVGGKIVENWEFDQDTSMFYQMGLKLVPAEQAAKK